MTTGNVRLRLLGPVELWVDGRAVPLRRSKIEALLTVLGVHANRRVSTGHLMSALWDDPPPSAAANLRNYFSEVHRLLSQAAEAQRLRLDRTGAGALLHANAAGLDLLEFDEQLRAARECAGGGDLASAARHYSYGLGLWRGDVADGLLRSASLGRDLNHVDDLRLDAIEEYADLRLELGEHSQLVGALRQIVARHPYRERAWASLMTALYRSGQAAAALEAYREAEHVLRAELGLTPTPRLQQIQNAILRHENTVLVPPTVTANRGGDQPGHVPAQLPLDIGGFAGRTRELAQLEALLASDPPPATVVIAVSGTAGVGKTALTVHWAHRVRHRFPDGQLYLNLRGFDPTGAAMTPAEAVRRFLDALDVPAHNIPTDIEAQAALYRTRLADKKMLVVLDNARDADQVRPLLPASPDCLVLVTSRHQLTSLVAAEGAHPLPLDLLSTDDARNLLAQRIGTDRVSAEPKPAEEIITLCARLPLALAVVAARAATHPDLPLVVLADQLRHAHDRLTLLSAGDATTDVRAALSWSYYSLSPAAARLFRLLGLHPGPDTSVAAAVSLAALPPSQIQPALTELARAHLLTEHTPGRYTFHDLLRAYANELAHTLDPDSQRQAAVHRLLDHYLHSSYAATLALDPTRDPIDLASPQPGVVPESRADHSQALAWFTAEHSVLLAAIDHAAVTGFDIHTWQLAWTLTLFLGRRGHWHDWAATQRTALAAARRLADPAAQANAHRFLAYAYLQMGRWEDAQPHFQQALDLYRTCGDRIGQANSHTGLASMWERQGRYAEALDHAQSCLDLYRDTGHQTGQANALNNIGWYQAHTGDHHHALASCQQALALLHELGDRDGQAVTLDSLGYINHHLGHHNQAVHCYQNALDLYRDLGDRYPEAATLTRLGDTHHVTGNRDNARHAWQHALDILTDLDHPDAACLRSKLDRA